MDPSQWTHYTSILWCLNTEQTHLFVILLMEALIHLRTCLNKIPSKQKDNYTKEINILYYQYQGNMHHSETDDVIFYKYVARRKTVQVVTQAIILFKYDWLVSFLLFFVLCSSQAIYVKMLCSSIFCISLQFFINLLLMCCSHIRS